MIHPFEEALAASGALSTQELHMDWFDRQIVQFIVWWAPFGGPSEEDTLPRFGLTPEQLARRFDRIVSKLSASEDRLGSDEAKLLAAVRRISPALCPTMSKDALESNPVRPA
jgi:hypothetical protein